MQCTCIYIRSYQSRPKNLRIPTSLFSDTSLQQAASRKWKNHQSVIKINAKKICSALITQRTKLAKKAMSISERRVEEVEYIFK
jgi:hypothetical protein